MFKKNENSGGEMRAQDGEIPKEKRKHTKKAPGER